MGKHVFKPIKLEEIAGEQHRNLLAHQKNRSLEAVTSLFMISPAFTLFIVTEGEDILYQGKFLNKAVSAYNGETFEPDTENEIYPMSSEDVRLEGLAATVEMRRRHRLI